MASRGEKCHALFRLAGEQLFSFLICSHPAPQVELERELMHLEMKSPKAACGRRVITLCVYHH